MVKWMNVALAGSLLCLSTMGAAHDSAPPLTEHGYGPVHMGMTQSDVESALGVKLYPDEGDFGSCHDTGVMGDEYPNMGFMFEDGKLTRISLFWNEDEPQKSGSFKTERGIGIGSTEADVHAAYGPDLIVETAEYDEEPAHSLTHWVKPEESGLRFVTNQDGIVRWIHVGTPSINYIEGCA